MARPKKNAQKVQENQANIDEKALFLHHLAQFEHSQLAVQKAKDALQRTIAGAKADGFIPADFKYALELRNEESARAQIVRKLRIASYLGSSLGDQLDLFESPAPVMDAAAIYDSGYVPFSAEELAEQQDEASKH